MENVPERGPATVGKKGAGTGDKGLSPSRLHRLLSFAAIWLMIGFIAGTLVLRGPVAWIVSHSQAAGWSPTRETVVMLAVIGSYVVASALLSYWLDRWRFRQGKPLRLAAPAVLVLLTGVAVWIWMNPPSTIQEGMYELEGRRFAFGPYPTSEIMADLEERGFTGVISLLHPAVVPFEPKLLSDERQLAGEHGLELVHAPMLPWVASNDSAMAILRGVAEESGGRYYVHCYLGRDRIAIARRVLLGEEATGSRMAGLSSGDWPAGRHPEVLERGPIYDLDDGVFLTPFPTEYEFADHFEGMVSILSLLPPESNWYEREEAMASNYGISLHRASIRLDPFDPKGALDAAEAARRLPRPLVVHEFLTESLAAEAFLQAYHYRRPPLPPRLFRTPLRGGEVRVIASNVAVGPRPEEGEFESLYQRGIRTISHVALDREMRGYRRLAEEAGLQWRAYDGSLRRLLDRLETGGPWYLYGSEAEFVAPIITEALGDPLPSRSSMRASGENVPPREIPLRCDLVRHAQRLPNAVADLLLGRIAPDLEVVRPLLPTGRPEAGEPFRVGVELRNRGLGPGSALVIAVLRDGVEVQGHSVEIPCLASQEVSVELTLDAGDHVFSIVAFDTRSDLDRLDVVPGLKVEVGRRDIRVADAQLSGQVELGDTARVRMTAANAGESTEIVTPVVVFVPEDDGRPVEFSPQMEDRLTPGDSVDFEFGVPSEILSPGSYRMWTILMTPGGEELARPEHRLPIEVLREGQGGLPAGRTPTSDSVPRSAPDSIS